LIVCVLWSWSGESLEEDHPLLSDEVLEGIGSAGAGYNTHRWRELAFLIAAVRDLKSRASEERKAILDDPWTFSGWLSGLHEARNRQLIHILPHLLFPETFERISSEGDKRLILASYGDAPEKEIRKWDTSKIDRALLDLRRSLEEEHGTDIDFYQDEFATEWKSQTKNWLLSWNPSRWEWNTIAEDRTNTIAGGHDEWTNETVVLDEEIRALKWKLWHGQVDRAIEHLGEIIADMSMLREQGDLDAGRIWQLAQPLLTYTRQNKSAIVDYGARYRSGRRIATALAESAVNSLTARRMVKKQQMRWSKRGAHLMLQVRAAVMNGNLREQLSYEPPIFKSRFDWPFKPTPPLLRAA
jgi:hypothetical protein